MHCRSIYCTLRNQTVKPPREKGIMNLKDLIKRSALYGLLIPFLGPIQDRHIRREQAEYEARGRDMGLREEDSAEAANLGPVLAEAGWTRHCMAPPSCLAARCIFCMSRFQAIGNGITSLHNCPPWAR